VPHCDDTVPHCATLCHTVPHSCNTVPKCSILNCTAQCRAPAEGGNQHQAAEVKREAGPDVAFTGARGNKAVVPRLTSPTPTSAGAAARVPATVSGSLSPTPPGVSEEGDSRAKLPAEKRRERVAGRGGGTPVPPCLLPVPCLCYPGHNSGGQGLLVGYLVRFGCRKRGLSSSAWVAWPALLHRCTSAVNGSC